MISARLAKFAEEHKGEPNLHHLIEWEASKLAGPMSGWRRRQVDALRERLGREPTTEEIDREIRRAWAEFRHSWPMKSPAEICPR
jgi:hypothetical protein